MHGSAAAWGDLDIFWGWSKRVEAPYLAPTCNYPSGGVLATAGLMRALGASESLSSDQRQEIQQTYRLILCAFETLWLALVILVFRRLASPSASWAPLVLYLIPSSWAGGAVWGQIDILWTACLWASIACFAAAALREGGRLTTSLAMTCGLLGIVLALQLKPIVLLAVPGLVGVLFVTVSSVGRRLGGFWAGLGLLVALAAASAAWLVLDRWYPVPESSGTFQFVLQHRSQHGEILHNHGANLWTFLRVPGSTTSREAFFGPLTPHGTGWLLFLGTLAWMTVRLAGGLVRSSSPRQGLLWSLAYIGLTQWSASVFLTGTQARYVLPAFAFVWLAGLGLGSRRMTVAAAVTGVVCGCFVLSLIDLDAFRQLEFLRQPRTAATAAFGGLILALWGYGSSLSRRFAWM